MKTSSVIETEFVLNHFINACVEQSSKNPYFLQCEILCAPLVESFPGVSPEELQYELLGHGLFDSSEWENLESRVESMKKQNIWQLLNQEYQVLKTLWKGPEIPIYIYPLTNLPSDDAQQLPIKNGVAYKAGLFLFLSDELRVEEIMALLAHEYNHVCRLNYLGLDPNEIPLKDSLIIEGFGELAVKELYGEKWQAPWIDLYSYNDSIEIWHNYFIPQLNLLGSDKHQLFLYGESGSKFPKWVGYHIGYQIVNSFQQKHGPFSSNYEIYQKSSDELIAGSIFPANASMKKTIISLDRDLEK